MMLISDRHKFLFCHIPKTAGRSIAGVIRGHCDRLLENQHLPMSEALAFEPGLMDYFKFSFVRNPFDRLLSLYRMWHHPRMMYPRGKLRVQRIHESEPKTFEDFIKDSCHIGLGAPQVEMLVVDGKIVADFVGRFERLEDDVSEVCKRIGIEGYHLGHIGATAAKVPAYSEHYSHYYTHEMRELVEERYRADLETFGYKFEEQT